MKIVGLIDEDFTQYKKPSMFIAMPFCTFKCEKECGQELCQNNELAKAKHIEIDNQTLINRYLDNPISKSIVFGGLEPIDSYDEVYSFIQEFRQNNLDDVVIYTGYYPEEITNKLEDLSKFVNIFIKFGRYVPGTEKRLDPILGVELYEPQWAEELQKGVINDRRKITRSN